MITYVDKQTDLNSHAIRMIALKPDTKITDINWDNILHITETDRSAGIRHAKKFIKETVGNEDAVILIESAPEYKAPVSTKEPKVGDLVQQKTLLGEGRKFIVAGIDETYNGNKRAYDSKGRGAYFTHLTVLDQEAADEYVFNLLSNMG